MILVCRNEKLFYWKKMPIIEKWNAVNGMIVGVTKVGISGRKVSYVATTRADILP